jgi:hypothetical protein
MDDDMTTKWECSVAGTPFRVLNSPQLCKVALHVIAELEIADIDDDQPQSREARSRRLAEKASHQSTSLSAASLFLL